MIARIAWTPCALSVSASYCKTPQPKQQPENKIPSVFHVGSLSVPMKNITAAFEKENPGIKVQLVPHNFLSKSSGNLAILS
jgi:ABC-type molybdate transport system substrate-binding protein